MAEMGFQDRKFQKYTKLYLSHDLRASMIDVLLLKAGLIDSYLLNPYYSLIGARTRV